MVDQFKSVLVVCALLTLSLMCSQLGAQEEPENHFAGRKVTVVMDDSESSLRALAVLLGIRENTISAIIIPEGAGKKKNILKLLRQAGNTDIPITTRWAITPEKEKQVIFCLLDTSLLKLAAIPEEMALRVLLFNQDTGISFDKSFLPGFSTGIISTVPGLALNASEIAEVKQIKTPLGRIYSSLLHPGTIPGPELLSLYLLYSELFDMKPEIREPRIERSVRYDPAMMKTVLMEVLAGEYHMGEGVAFAGFPLDAGNYKQDVRRIMDTALSRYGITEWKACVLTDEIHGHLGIYSIMGAKMGIRALEYFRVGPDRLNVLSFAGSRPPVSCLNDGIQVSTGATIGQGTIHLAEGVEIFPGAEFEYQGIKIRITIRANYLDQIEADIASGIAEYGLLNAGYWKLIRNLSLQYWRDWNRNELFDITVID
jgi:hypothetical protein